VSKASRRARKRSDPELQPLTRIPAGPAPGVSSALPRGRIPAIGMRELVAAIHRRRERRRGAAAELGNSIQRLAASVEQHLVRVAAVRQAIEAQGGDLSALKHYDTMMARLRAELRGAERALAEAFSSAAQS
jgi:hypothetical protein